MTEDRRGKILELIEEKEIGTQQELVDALRALGYQVTQATVSRDIRLLRLTKTTGADGRQRYLAPPNTDDAKPSRAALDKYMQVFRNAYHSMDAAGNLIVIRTTSGMAMALAAAVDQMGISQIVGSIAGDDTIMVATKSDQDALIAMKKLRKLTTR